MTEMQQEAAIKKQTQGLKGADYVVTGSIAEFGRKEVGDPQLFGILGRGKEQAAYAKVNLNVVNVSTSEVVFSTSLIGMLVTAVINQIIANVSDRSYGIAAISNQRLLSTGRPNGLLYGPRSSRYGTD